MRFGYYLLNTYVPELDGDAPILYERWLEQIDAAEDLGFDSLWVTEHHFRLFGGMMPSPQMLLAAAAQRTRRLRLGSAVSLVPMHHPIRLAEDYAMLDLLSKGRLNFGAGRGMSVAEYGVFEKEWRNAQERLEEALTVIKLAWTEPVLEWHGPHYQYGGLTVRPKPSQQPHPPIYVPANKEPANFRMIARNGYNLMTLPWITGNEEQRTRIQWYLDELAASGRARAEHEVFVMYPIYVGESDAQAQKDAEDAWHRWRGFALEELSMDPGRASMLEQIKGKLSYSAMVGDNRGVFGGPDRCIEHLRCIRDIVGPDHIGLCFHFGGLSQAQVLGSMERFSRYVRPEIEAKPRDQQHGAHTEH